MIDFTKLKKVKRLQKGGKSKSVYLMENGIIKKSYNSNDQRQIHRFNQEIRILKYLQQKNCPFVPKLLHINSKKHDIFMTYTGKTLSNTQTNRTRLSQKVKELHLDYNVMRHRNKKPNYNIYISNGTIQDGKIYVIDFGSPHYRII